MYQNGQPKQKKEKLMKEKQCSRNLNKKQQREKGDKD
jgi:hypothetical protein